MQRCLSGLRSTIGNRVTGGTRPEVRILFSAPAKNTPISGVFFCFRVGRDCRNSELSEVRASAVRKRPLFFSSSRRRREALLFYNNILFSAPQKRDMSTDISLFCCISNFEEDSRGEPRTGVSVLPTHP